MESILDQEDQELRKFVKPENYEKLPRSGQVYFYIHRAIEAGEKFAMIPVGRGVAASGISAMKDEGVSYHATLTRIKLGTLK